MGRPAIAPLVVASIDDNMGQAGDILRAIDKEWDLTPEANTALVEVQRSIQSTNEHRRWRACGLMGLIRDPSSVPIMVKAASNDNETSLVRCAAIKSLGLLLDYDKMAIVAFLTKISRDEDERLAVAAVEGLGQSETHLQFLLKLLNDQRKYVARAAATALGRTGNTDAIDTLVAVLDDPFVCREAINSLARIGGTNAIGRIGDVLKAGVLEGNRDIYFLQDVGIAYATLRYGGEVSKALQAALRDGNEYVVAAAYDNYLRTGYPGSEVFLVRVLDLHGNTLMAQAFLNCGNQTLSSAAERWARQHNVAIVPLKQGTQTFPPVGPGWSPQWPNQSNTR